MDGMTQQNAALVEQAAAAAESLHEQTVNLSRAVAIFRIAPGGAEGPTSEVEQDAPADDAPDAGFHGVGERRSAANSMRPKPVRALPAATPATARRRA